MLSYCTRTRFAVNKSFFGIYITGDMTHSLYMRAEFSWFASEIHSVGKAVMRQALYFEVVTL